MEGKATNRHVFWRMVWEVEMLRDWFRSVFIVFQCSTTFFCSKLFHANFMFLRYQLPCSLILLFSLRYAVFGFESPSHGAGCLQPTMINPTAITRSLLFSCDSELDDFKEPDELDLFDIAFVFSGKIAILN